MQASVVTDFATPTLRVTDTPIPPTETPPPVTEAPTLTNTPEPTATATSTPTPTATSTASATPTPTLPPQGVQGRQDLLALLRDIDPAIYPWSSEQFAPGPDGTFWRLGVGSATGGDVIYIRFTPELLETHFGNNAAGRIRRLEATLTLTTFNPPLLLDDAVYFGALLQDAGNLAASAGLQVQLAEAGVINLGQRTGDTVRTLSQRSVNAVVVRVRLERDPQTGVITTYFNDEQLGEPLQLAGADAAVIPVLYVKDGGVIVSVTDWRVTLR